MKRHLFIKRHKKSCLLFLVTVKPPKMIKAQLSAEQVKELFLKGSGCVGTL